MFDEKEEEKQSNFEPPQGGSFVVLIDRGVDVDGEHHEQLSVFAHDGGASIDELVERGYLQRIQHDEINSKE